jgi:putative zinc finger protein
MSECEALRERFSEYVDGELDTAGRAAIDVHVAACAECREAFASFRETVEDVRRFGLVAPPDDFGAGVRRRVEAAGAAGRSSRRLPFVSLGLAAAVLLAVVAGFLAMRQMVVRETPPPTAAAEGYAAPIAASADEPSDDVARLDSETDRDVELRRLTDAPVAGKRAAELDASASPPLDDELVGRLAAVGYASGAADGAGFGGTVGAGLGGPQGTAKEQAEQVPRQRGAASAPAAAADREARKADAKALKEELERNLDEIAASPSYVFVVVDGQNAREQDRLLGLLHGNGEIVGTAEVTKREPATEVAQVESGGREPSRFGAEQIRRVSVYEFQSRTRSERDIAGDLEREFQAFRGEDLPGVLAQRAQKLPAVAPPAGGDAGRSEELLAKTERARVDDARKKDGAGVEAVELQNERGKPKAPTPGPPRLVVLYRHPIDEK